MVKVKETILAVVVGVLIVLFVQSFSNALVDRPSYDEFCGELDRPDRNASEEEMEEFEDEREACQDELEDAQDRYSLIVFLISSLFALITILTGLYLPSSGYQGVVGAGLLLGGLFTLFVGTTRGWSGLADWIRPIVLLIELCIVIYVGYRRIDDHGKES